MQRAGAELRERAQPTAVNVEEIIRGLRPSEQSAADALFTAIRVLPVREADAKWSPPKVRRGLT